MKAKFSIRYKFLAVTTLLLIMCVGAYLALATDEFKKDKKSLVFDYNQSIVTNAASDFDSFFSGIGDKMKLISVFFRESERKRQMLIEQLIDEKSELVYVLSSEKFDKNLKPLFLNEEYFKLYEFEGATWLDQLQKQRPLPFQSIQVDGVAIWNATIENGPALIGYGKTVIEVDAQGVPLNQYAVIGFIKADRIIKTLTEGRPNEVYVVGKNGDMLAHSNPEVMKSSEIKKDKLVEIALVSPIRKKVESYQENEQNYLAAFAKMQNGQAIVLSKISEGQAFRAVNRLIARSLLFATTIVTLAFIVAILFSRSITRPLDTLMSGMSKVASGDLQGQIQVRSQDEISLLANSFNRMIVDLRRSRAELEEINRELENKVKARTHELELQNQAVKEAQEALLKSTRLAAVGEVAGQAAHEVLNPLTTIISRLNKLNKRVSEERSQEAKVLLDMSASWSEEKAKGGFEQLVKAWQTSSSIKAGTSLWDEDTQNIKQIGESLISEFQNLKNDTQFLIDEAERIGRIVNSFRTLSTHKADLKEESLHKLVQKSIHIMADLASKEQVQIISRLSANDDKVKIDDDEFIQVMTNLIRNAIHSVKGQFAGVKGGQIEISTALHAGHCEVHIKDNGVGIIAEHQSKLFEKNFTTKAKTDGSGIGLSISRRLVRSFNGDLILKSSSLGKGAEFVILVPLVSGSLSNRGVA
jgi:two-component system, NtrC family, sensor kinase